MKETVPGEKEDIHMYRDDDEDETYSGDSESESEGNMSRIQAVYCPFFEGVVGMDYGPDTRHRDTV